MKSRVVMVLMVLGVAASACTDSASDPTTTSITAISTTSTTAAVSTTTAPTTSTTTTTVVASTALIVEVPGGPCEGIGDAPGPFGGEISFIVGANLFVADPDTGDIQCVAEVVPELGTAMFPPRLEWGAGADRLLVENVIFTADGRRESAGALYEPVHFTRPSGSSTIWVEDGRLLKQPITGGEVSDISFLDSHDAVTYHPSGLEIVTSGMGTDGVYGVYVASNQGTDPSRIVNGTDVEVTEFAWTSDGFVLYFIADHGDVTHLHSTFPADPGVTDEGGFFEETASEAGLFGLVVSQWDYVWAVTSPCTADQDATVAVSPGLDPLPSEFDGVSVVARGWLPEGRLVVTTHPVSCDEPGDLWIVDYYTAGAPETTLVYSGTEVSARTGLGIQAVGVSTAATRAPHPDPPPPLGDFDPDDFA
ncbi:MAG: hypothetical protein HKN01_03700 [Acidimicrobiia bacterium]|nr:hypothetical protein [Acidimicrobiia bacterium]